MCVCVCGGGGGGRDFLYWLSKISQYFEGAFFQISLNFLLSFTSYFKIYCKLMTSGMSSFNPTIFEKSKPVTYCDDYWTKEKSYNYRLFSGLLACPWVSSCPGFM